MSPKNRYCLPVDQVRGYSRPDNADPNKYGEVLYSMFWTYSNGGGILSPDQLANLIAREYGVALNATLTTYLASEFSNRQRSLTYQQFSQLWDFIVACWNNFCVASLHYHNGYCVTFETYSNILQMHRISYSQRQVELFNYYTQNRRHLLNFENYFRIFLTLKYNL